MRKQDHLKYCQDLNQLSEPFNKQMSINYFGFSRVYPDGRFWVLGSNPEVIDYHFYKKKSLPSGFSNFTQIDNGLSYQSLYNCTQVWDWPEELISKFQEQFRIINPLLIFYKNGEQYLDQWWFSSPTKNMHEIYLNHSTVFNNFRHYVKEQTRDIVSVLEQNIMQVDKQYSQQSFDDNKHQINSDISLLNQQFTPRHYEFYYGGELIVLTRREYECLQLIARGNTNKTAARKLGISDRTVECHLDKVKVKLSTSYFL